MTYAEAADKYGKLKPILFSTPMVQAILGGRKTQTRRVIKPEPFFAKDGKPYLCRKEKSKHIPIAISDKRCLEYAPYQVGDILYVRETYAISDGAELPEGIYYRANPKAAIAVSRNWRPSIHMIREIARIFLRVKNVRVERLQDISDEDAKAEGCYAVNPSDLPAISDMKILCGLYTAAFYLLWDRQYAKRGYGWDANPWVWVLEFENISEEA